MSASGSGEDCIGTGCSEELARAGACTCSAGRCVCACADERTKSSMSTGHEPPASAGSYPASVCGWMLRHHSSTQLHWSKPTCLMSGRAGQKQKRKGTASLLLLLSQCGCDCQVQRPLDCRRHAAQHAGSGEGHMLEGSPARWMMVPLAVQPKRVAP